MIDEVMDRQEKVMVIWNRKSSSSESNACERSEPATFTRDCDCMGFDPVSTESRSGCTSEASKGAKGGEIAVGKARGPRTGMGLWRTPT